MRPGLHISPHLLLLADANAVHGRLRVPFGHSTRLPQMWATVGRGGCGSWMRSGSTALRTKPAADKAAADEAHGEPADKAHSEGARGGQGHDR